MTLYTHNLKIILLDNNSNIVEDQFFLADIKNILSKSNIHPIEWNGKMENITIKWDKKKLSEVDKHFMGDLFSIPIYEMDSIILKHTENTISKINSKYTIKFYISRIIADKICSKYTCDIIN